MRSIYHSVIALLFAARAAAEDNEAFEWIGVFSVSDTSHTWMAQKVDGAYADPTMKLVMIATDSPTATTMEDLEDDAAVLIEGTCTVVTTGQTMTPTTTGVCYQLTFDDTNDDTTFTIDTTGVTGIVFAAEHVPTEFERDTHYLYDSAGTDIEPTAEEGGQSYAFFQCSSDGSLVSYGEECLDEACGDCEVSGINVSSPACYMAGGYVHYAACDSAGYNVTVSIYTIAGLDCASDVTLMSPDEVHIEKPGCAAEEHDHGGDADDDSAAYECSTFKDIFASGEELCNNMWGDSFYYERNESIAYTWWYFDMMNSPNDAATVARGLDVPNTCNVTYFHKSEPSPEGDDFTECHPWKENACCHEATVTTVDAMNNAYGDGYRWDRCGTLSQACERFFVAEACFYECDVNAGHFRTFSDAQVAACTDDFCAGNTWSVSGIPMKASYCDSFYVACYNDYFHNSGNYWTAYDAHTGADDDAFSSTTSVGTSQVITLDGSGTTNPSKVYWETLDLFAARAVPPVKMTYRAVGSSTGQCEFMGYCSDVMNPAGNYVPYNDFGSGDVPFDQDDYDTMVAAGRTFAHFPFLLGAMSFFHNIPDSEIPSGGLKMTACILAKIFSRQITTWDDAEIMAINPDLGVPSGTNINVYHRVYGSSTTAGITTYLNAACPSVWTADLVGKTITWPTDTFDAEGSGNMAAALASVDYSIGYIDSGHGHDDGLNEIELQNMNGTYQSSLEAMAVGGISLAAAEALALGVLPSDPTKSFANVSLHNMPGQYTWPIVAVSYVYVDLDQTNNGEKGPLLKAWLEFLISTEGQELVQEYNFRPLPSAVVSLSQSVIDMMQLPDTSVAPQWSFETSDSTQKGDGQAQYVISGKRQSWYKYAIENNEDEIETLTTAVGECATGTDYTTLATMVTTLETELTSVSTDLNAALQTIASLSA